MITKNIFGYTQKGEEVFCFTLTDGDSYVKILNYGGAIQSIVIPDKNGALTDVMLGYNTVAEYEKNRGCLGALIGRFGNRIEKGKLTIDGVAYQLFCNNGVNHLHGGKEGFNKKVWKAAIEGEKLILTYFSPDGEENYPGNLQVRVIYTFQRGALKIEYYAVSDKKTAINLTNHAYFNLNGEAKEPACDNLLWINGDYITPTDAGLIPTGEFRAVKGTPFDFNTPKAIEQDLNAEDADLKKGKGYDHCFLLKHACGEYSKYAEAYSPKTGIKMTCYTDMPAVQLYTANHLRTEGKTGYYDNYSGFCLETQAIPNNVNVPVYAEKGSSIYDAGQEYRFTAAYCFTVEK